MFSFFDPKSWSSDIHVMFIKSLITGNLHQIEVHTNEIMRSSMLLLTQIYDSKEEAKSLTYCTSYINETFSLDGIVLSERNRRDCAKIGKEPLSVYLAQYAETAQKSASEASENAIHFLSNIVKVLKTEAIIFSGGHGWRAAHASISHAVGAELIAFMEYIDKDKDRRSCPISFDEPLCLDGVATECMFHHLIKAYKIDFKGFPDFMEDVKAATAIKEAVSQVCLPPPSPGVFGMSIFGE